MAFIQTYRPAIWFLFLLGICPFVPIHPHGTAVKCYRFCYAFHIIAYILVTIASAITFDAAYKVDWLVILSSVGLAFENLQIVLLTFVYNASLMACILKGQTHADFLNYIEYVDAQLMDQLDIVQIDPKNFFKRHFAENLCWACSNMTVTIISEWTLRNIRNQHIWWEVIMSNGMVIMLATLSIIVQHIRFCGFLLRTRMQIIAKEFGSIETGRVHPSAFRFVDMTSNLQIKCETVFGDLVLLSCVFDMIMFTIILYLMIANTMYVLMDHKGLAVLTVLGYLVPTIVKSAALAHIFVVIGRNQVYHSQCT